jgi:molybdopterin-guanine dinucleotide biosynthesis protein A
MHRGDISGVILAGGRGSRLDGDDKGLVDVADRPMISYVIERFVPQVSSLFINANRNTARYREFGYPVVADTVDGFAGPLAGIAAVLALCKAEYLATAPCDSPFLPEDLVPRLAAALETANAEIGVATSGGRPQPVFALISSGLADSLSEYLSDGGRKILTWYRQRRLVAVDFGPDESPFANINAPGDLATAAGRLRGQ